MRTSKINDFSADKLKEYLENKKITTNGIWLSEFNEKPLFGKFLIPKRSDFPKNSKDFHGLYIPEIPYQMIMRFTKEKGTVWSQFGGSGTDYYICELLKRKCYINDINPFQSFIEYGDSRYIKLPEKVDLILSHPPYWDMVKYSEDPADGSSKKTLKEFLLWWVSIVENSINNLKDGGYFIIVCGNMYKNSEEIELGSILMNIALSKGFILKQHIIKDYGETKGSEKKHYNVNYYRQLMGGYGNFYGDNIFILKKCKSKNDIANLLKDIL